MQSQHAVTLDRINIYDNITHAESTVTPDKINRNFKACVRKVTHDPNENES
jgi:hypothetical protein